MEPMTVHPLTRFRQASKLSRSELARKVNTSRQSIYRIEAGKQTPSLALVSRLIEIAKEESRDLRADDFLPRNGATK
jgi:DNA-binding XRE family transcriptional regulator